MVININNVKYKVIVLTSSGSRINITPAIEEASWEEKKGEIAQRATFRLANVKYKKGRLMKVLPLCSRIFIYAKWKSKWNEVFRGIEWSYSNDRGNTDSITITAYSNLKYMQETEEDMYFGKGQTTKSICEEILKKAKIEMSWNYSANIEHKKQVLKRSRPSEALLSTLNMAKDKKGVKYVVYGKKGKCFINNMGYNNDVYCFHSANVMSGNKSVTLDGMVTKVVVRSTDDEKDKKGIDVKVNGNTKYGSLKRILVRPDVKTPSEAKKIAEQELEEKGKPTKALTLVCPDVPEIRKGYKVRLQGVFGLKGNYHVVGVTHVIESLHMTMELEKV